MTDNDNSGKSLKEVAIDALRSVCVDSEAPPAARAQSARTLLEFLNELGRNSSGNSNTDEKDLSSLSASELDKEIRRLSGKR
jgi:ABC-type uncharacterized transport system involved in gliding motility auxiliary subunit